MDACKLNRKVRFLNPQHITQHILKRPIEVRGYNEVLKDVKTKEER